MGRTDPNVLKTTLARRNEQLRAGLTMGPPTPEMLADFQANRAALRTRAHQTDRGKHDVANELSITISELEALFIGKSILDIGCGVGRFSADIARLKRTQVTALDVDPEVLSKVRTGKNLRAILGSGMELPEEIAGEQFDVVVSCFSSVAWAESPEAKQKALDTALRATHVGGTALLIPVVSNPTYRKQATDSVINHQYLEGTGKLNPLQALNALHGFYTCDWLDVQTFDRLSGLEADGIVDTTFTASVEAQRRNLQREDYSAITRVISEIPAL